jgi:hypothetical protein
MRLAATGGAKTSVQGAATVSRKAGPKAMRPFSSTAFGYTSSQVSHAPEKECDQGQLSSFWALLVKEPTVQVVTVNPNSGGDCSLGFARLLEIPLQRLHQLIRANCTSTSMSPTSFFTFVKAASVESQSATLPSDAMNV